MLITELVERVRQAPGETIHAQIAAVLETVAGDPAELLDTFWHIAPLAILEYDRRTLKSSNLPERAIPSGRQLDRKDPLRWRKVDFQIWQGWTGKTGSTFLKLSAIFRKIVAEFTNDEETYGQIRSRLPEETRQPFERWVKLRHLAA